MTETAKSQAAEIYRTPGVCPFEPAQSLEAGDPQKVPHFGYLGRVIETTVTAFQVASEVDSSVIETTTHPEGLSRALTRLFMEVDRSVEDSGELADEWQYLTASQRERHELNPNKWGNARKTLEVGFRNFSELTSPHLYDTLAYLFDTEERIGCISQNWPLLYDLASLNARQLDVFGNHFFLHDRDSLRSIIDKRQTEDDTTYLRFQDGFPQGVRIPSSFDPQNLTKPGEDSYDLGDVVTDGPTIGCPIIFKPKLVRDLWALYIEQRQRIEVETRQL